MDPVSRQLCHSEAPPNVVQLPRVEITGLLLSPDDSFELDVEHDTQHASSVLLLADFKQIKIVLAHYCYYIFEFDFCYKVNNQPFFLEEENEIVNGGVSLLSVGIPLFQLNFEV